MKFAIEYDMPDYHNETYISVDVEAARAEVINIVNNFFYDKLTALPQIKLYIEEAQI